MWVIVFLTKEGGAFKAPPSTGLIESGALKAPFSFILSYIMKYTRLAVTSDANPFSPSKVPHKKPSLPETHQ